MYVFTSDNFIPDIHVHALWCVSALSAFAVLVRGGTVKSPREDNYKTYLCHTASGWAIRLLVYLLRHTPSHWGSVTPHPSSTSSFLLNSLLTPLLFSPPSPHPSLDASSFSSWRRRQSHTSKCFFLVVVVPASKQCCHHCAQWNYSKRLTYLILLFFLCCFVPFLIVCFFYAFMINDDTK